MAKIGLKNFRYSVLTEASDGTPSYAGAKTPAKAVSCSVSISNNEAELYADDGLAEHIRCGKHFRPYHAIDPERMHREPVRRRRPG